VVGAKNDSKVWIFQYEINYKWLKTNHDILKFYFNLIFVLRKFQCILLLNSLLDHGFFSIFVLALIWYFESKIFIIFAW
jgi:hypothetical protein